VPASANDINAADSDEGRGHDGKTV
jgi:hypothetical protein